MINLLTFDFESEVHNFENDKKEYKSPFEVSDLHHMIPILAALPIVRNESGKISTSEIMQKVKGMEFIDTINGKMNARNFSSMMHYTYIVPRSKFIGNQCKEPKLAQLTPLPLYAQKLHNNISYGQWDVFDPNFRWVLNTYLEPILNFQTTSLILDSNDIMVNRKRVLAYGPKAKKAGQMGSLTQYNCKLSDIMIEGELLEAKKEYIQFDKVVIQMLLQLWLANASVRDVDSMILDPFNIENIPRAIDEEIKKVSVTREKFGFV
jgi:hypothetical protein